MTHQIRLSLLGIALCSLPTQGVEIVDGLELDLSGRYRYQDVNDAQRGDAEASTLKLRLTALWKASDNWRAMGQFDHVSAFNENRFNSVTVARATSPVPDPPGNELNQFWVHYLSDNDWSLKLGRQGVGLDNERHVGTVEFWQNDQTFDAIRFAYSDNVQWQADYLYVSKAHRIFGDDAVAQLSPQDIRFDLVATRPVTELGNHQHDTHLFNLAYQFDRQLTIGAFAYLIDNQTAQVFSSHTFGLRIAGEHKPAKVKYGYTLEYARQSDAHDNPWRFDADYWLAEISAQYKSHQFTLSHERLGEDNGFGFATTLGTNHKFQGWADVFNNYFASGGLQDTYLTYRGRSGKLRWRLVVHQFEGIAEKVTAGHELDVEVAYRYDRQWEFKFIGAKYLADEGLSGLAATQQDVTTWMVSAAYNL